MSRHDAVAELDEDIALVQAELDAADHAAKDALARVEAGDENVTADDLRRLRGLGEFLNARLRGLRARRAAAADDRRLRGIAEIRGEVEAYAAKAGDDLVNAERALLDAAVALRERLHAHNAVVAGWRSIWQRTSAFPCTAADHRFHRNATAGSPPLGDGIAVGLQRVAKAEIDQIIGRAMDHAAKVGTVGIDPASLPSGSSQPGDGCPGPAG